VKYRLVYQPQAAEELDRAIEWSFSHYPTQAVKWCGEFLSAIETLASDPDRHPLARENGQFEETVRQLVFGRGKSIYRVLYVIQDDVVRILHIRYPGQPLLR
jgi:plasmid stabilization system protein ParE